jgi:hypothetical protein
MGLSRRQAPVGCVLLLSSLTTGRELERVIGSQPFLALEVPNARCDRMPRPMKVVRAAVAKERGSPPMSQGRVRPVRRTVPGLSKVVVGVEIAYQDYLFQMGKLESHLLRLRDSWNIVSSVTVAKASCC